MQTPFIPFVLQFKSSTDYIETPLLKTFSSFASTFSIIVDDEFSFKVSLD